MDGLDVILVASKDAPYSKEEFKAAIVKAKYRCLIDRTANEAQHMIDNVDSFYKEYTDVLNAAKNDERLLLKLIRQLLRRAKHDVSGDASTNLPPLKSKSTRARAAVKARLKRMAEAGLAAPVGADNGATALPPEDASSARPELPDVILAPAPGNEQPADSGSGTGSESSSRPEEQEDEGDDGDSDAHVAPPVPVGPAMDTTQAYYAMAARTMFAENAVRLLMIDKPHFLRPTYVDLWYVVYRPTGPETSRREADSVYMSASRTQPLTCPSGIPLIVQSSEPTPRRWRLELERMRFDPKKTAAIVRIYERHVSYNDVVAEFSRKVCITVHPVGDMPNCVM
jgi:hypothetical protein